MNKLSRDWTAPGAEAVVPGVWRIPLPLSGDGLRAVNAYVIDAGDGLTVIDPGCASPDTSGGLARALHDIDRGPAEIRRCLVTHVHYDHYTNAVAMRREFGPTVALGAGEEPALRLLQTARVSDVKRDLARLERLGGRSVAQAIRACVPIDPIEDKRWELPDTWLLPGVISQADGTALTVIHTPGHTTGHVVFHDPARRILFAGDHVLPTITPSVGYEPILSANPLASFLSSLALLLEQDDAVLLPAHGPVAPSVHGRVAELLEHHARRLDETLSAVGAGSTTPFEAAARLRWTRRQRAFGDLDMWNQMLAVFETGAHLELLASQGRIVDAGGPDGALYLAG